MPATRGAARVGHRQQQLREGDHHLGERHRVREGGGGLALLRHGGRPGGLCPLHRCGEGIGMLGRVGLT
jgi:hypothetical protein